MPSEETLKKLKEAGLDEIRMHPSKDVWDHFYGSAYHQAMQQAMGWAWTPASRYLRLPSVPEIERAVAEAGGFLNLNELEFSETNCEAMKEQGYVRKDDVSNAVQGSETSGARDSFK